MTRVLERLEDFRPLYDTLMGGDASPELRARYRGTELIQCGDGTRCLRAIIARGPLDMDLTLELVDDEGWAYHAPWHWCPQHSASCAGSAR